MTTADDDKPGNRPIGKRDGVSHDARGNAVWQWAVDSGKQVIESTSQLLKRLEVPGLKLEEDASAPHKKPEVLPDTPAAPVGPKGNVGYDPYAGRRGTKAAPQRPAATKPAAAPPPRPSLLRRLFRRD